MFANPRDVPPVQQRPKISALVNSLVIFTTTGETKTLEVQGDNGPEMRTASIVGIQPVDGQYAGKVYDDMYLWPRALQAAIADYPPGTLVLGRITKPGPAYELAQPTPADIKAAEALLTGAAGDPPF